MLKQNQKANSGFIKKLNNQRGISTIEILPVLMLFPMLVGFAMGFFGIIHSGILNSIAARNYAFETFRNRADLKTLRDNSPEYASFYYGFAHCRFHGIHGEDRASNSQNWVATKRTVTINGVYDNPGGLTSVDDHNKKIRDQIAENKKVSTVFTSKGGNESNSGAASVWIMTVYGICLDNQCCQGSAAGGGGSGGRII